MELFSAALTLSPLLMVVVAVLFGHKVASERQRLADGQRIPFFFWTTGQRAHNATVVVGAFVASAAPVVAMTASMFGLIQDHPVGWLQGMVIASLCVQLFLTGFAVAERVTNGVRMPGE